MTVLTRRPFSSLSDGAFKAFTVAPGTPVYLWVPPSKENHFVSFKCFPKSQMVLGTQYDDACGGTPSDPQISIPVGATILGQTSGASAIVLEAGSTSIKVGNVGQAFENGECLEIAIPGGATIYVTLTTFTKVYAKIAASGSDDETTRSDPTSALWIDKGDELVDLNDLTYVGKTCGFKLEAFGATVVFGVNK